MALCTWAAVLSRTWPLVQDPVDGRLAQTRLVGDLPDPMTVQETFPEVL